jgi:hypothetical protein
LDSRRVGRPPHDPAERIDFTHDSTLGDSPDRRVTGHLTYGLEILGKQESSRTTSGGESGSLGAGVSAAYDNDVVIHSPVPYSVTPASSQLA